MTLDFSTLAGLALLGLLALDVFITVLQTSAGAGPYTSVQNRAIWRVMRGLASTLPGGRSILSWAAPIMALATPAAWVVLLTAGFAFLYEPVVLGFPEQPTATVSSWLQAFYYSGFLTTTLGMGDIVPTGGLWRLLAVIQGGMGFALFSAAITYILTIYSRHTQEAAVALHVHNVFRDTDLGDWGAPGSRQRDLVRSLALGTSEGLAGVNVAHQQYPILHYFHGRPEHALVAQVGRLVDLVCAAPEEEKGGVARVLARSLVEFMDRMPFDTLPGEDDLQARSLRLLRAHGYTAEVV